jgi:TolB-like protein/DNA-binding winged helix-turn-helix (wHTH) protein
MDCYSSSDVFLFEGYRFDSPLGRLVRLDEAGVVEPVVIGGRALDLLRLLLERAGQLVSKNEIMEAVWPRAAVKEGNITVQMSSLRRILDQDRTSGTCIQTVARRGYRFIAPVTRVGGSAAHGAAHTGVVTYSGATRTESHFGKPPSQYRIVSPARNRAPALLAPFDRPSVAVMPFIDMSGDANRERISDAIAEDIIVALSRYPSLFVRARGLAFAYKGQAIDTRRVAREMGVCYVVEGSVRDSGDRVRVTCWLVDAATGNQIWSERYDRHLADDFAAHDEIVTEVSVALAYAVAQTEQRRALLEPERSLTAWGSYQRGLWHRARMSARDNAIAEQLFERAIELDPTFAGGYRALALAQMDAATQLQVRGLEEARTSAETLVARAVALDRADAEAHSAFAAILLIGHGDHEGARIEVERALALSPHLASAHGVLGAVLTYSGQPKEALASFATYMKLDPHHPTIALRLQQITAALYFSGEYEAAIKAGNVRSGPIATVHRFIAGWPPPWSGMAEFPKRRRRWRRRSPSSRRHSTCTSASACRGCGPVTTRSWSTTS